MLAGTSLPKAAKRSNTQGWFTRRRSLSLDGGSSADVTPAALGMQGRPETAPTRLADAESMLPKAALQNLRDDALARYASPSCATTHQARGQNMRHSEIPIGNGGVHGYIYHLHARQVCCMDQRPGAHRVKACPRMSKRPIS